MNDLTLGQKIKYFRKRAGMSQLDLEVSLGTSSGAISRIESGRVNPTKETLYSISEILNLKSVEIASLFNIDLNYTENILDIINNFTKERNVDNMLQIAINEIAYKLDFISTATFILKGRKLFAYMHSLHPIVIKSLSLVGKPFRDLYVDEKINPNNLLLRSALENKIFESNDVYEFGQGVISRFIAKGIMRISGYKRGIAVPLSTPNKTYGTIFFSKKDTNDYSSEKKILILLANQIAINIEKMNVKFSN